MVVVVVKRVVVFFFINMLGCVGGWGVRSAMKIDGRGQTLKFLPPRLYRNKERHSRNILPAFASVLVGRSCIIFGGQQFWDGPAVESKKQRLP